MTKTVDECKKYNLDSVRLIFSGAAPLGEETVQDMKRLWPKWNVAQGYGEQFQILYLFRYLTWGSRHDRSRDNCGMRERG